MLKKNENNFKNTIKDLSDRVKIINKELDKRIAAKKKEKLQNEVNNVIKNLK